MFCRPSSTRYAVAQPITSSAYTGTYWIFMHAGGGWDPTHLCDPKGRANENENDPMGRFLQSDIRTAGNIEYAPLGDDGTALDAFFQEHYQRLLVINGMDTGTNGHDQGTRGTWSGRTAEGHPPIGALIAATHGPSLPMPLIGYGGYLDTQGVTNAVPLGDGGLLHNLAFPARPDPTGSEENYFGHKDVPGVIQREQQLRLLRLQGPAAIAAHLGGPRRAGPRAPRSGRPQARLRVAPRELRRRTDCKGRSKSRSRLTKRASRSA